MPLTALPPRAKGCRRQQLLRLLLPPAAVKEHPGEQEGETGPSTKPRGEHVHRAPEHPAPPSREPPALTGEVLPSMGRDQGWAGLRAPARSCQQRGAEQSQLRGAGGAWRAGSYVSAGSKPVGPAARLQRRRFPNCSRRSLQNICPVPAGPGMRGRGSGALGIREQVRPGPRAQQHPGVPRCSPGCPSPPSSPLCPPLTHPQLSCPAKRR